MRVSASHSVFRDLLVASIVAPLLPFAALYATGPVTVTVAFSTPAQAKLERFGKDEGAVLRARIETAIARACEPTRTPQGATVAVTVEDIAPTHPTREQLAAEPSLDPVRTRLLGGGSFTGVLQDGSGTVVATVRHQHYPPTLHWRSPSLDPWADADIAIEQFASQVGKACRRASVG
ncbi:MAG: hypothetical protein PVSMB6_05500 [Steroidobacteraceae bacterium]